jgi:hypothetical protein
MLAPYLDKPITSIKRSHIQRQIDELRDEAEPAAARAAHGFEHVLFKWALKREYVDINPAAGVDVPAEPPPTSTSGPNGWRIAPALMINRSDEDDNRSLVTGAASGVLILAVPACSLLKGKGPASSGVQGLSCGS